VDATKSTSGHIMLNLCFCIRCDLRVTYCVLMHPGHKTLMHYFSCSGGSGAAATTSVSGHITMNLCFHIRWDLQFAKCVLVSPGHETMTHYFSFSGWPDADATQSDETCYVEIVFLHLVGSVGHVGCSGASRA
jgi:hypothetical protein